MTCMIPATISKFESSDKQIFESIYFQSIHFSSQILDTYFCCACNGLFNDHQSLSTHIYSEHVYTVEYYEHSTNQTIKIKKKVCSKRKKQEDSAEQVKKQKEN